MATVKKAAPSKKVAQKKTVAPEKATTAKKAAAPAKNKAAEILEEQQHILLPDKESAAAQPGKRGPKGPRKPKGPQDELQAEIKPANSTNRRIYPKEGVDLVKLIASLDDDDIKIMRERLLMICQKTAEEWPLYPNDLTPGKEKYGIAAVKIINFLNALQNG